MPEWLNWDNAQLLGGFLISGAYVPQIMRMLKTRSSQDVSMGFLWMILTSLLLMSGYSLSKHFTHDAGMLALVVTNILNLLMVILTLIVAHRLRREAKIDAGGDSTAP